MNNTTRIDQVLESFSRYDAIGNDVILFRDLIRKAGFKSEIYAMMGADGRDSFPHYEFFQKAKTHNAVIHHFSIASNLVYTLLDFKGYRITRYHNITPAHFFPFPQTRFSYSQCQLGRAQLPILKDASDTFLAASQYNADELTKLSFKPGSVLPVLRRYDHLTEIKPNKKILNALANKKVKTILFVGRIIPNKCQHDLVFMLDQYKRHFDSNVRLVLVGGQDPFYGRTFLKHLISDTSLTCSYLDHHEARFQSDVVFAGGVDDASLAAYYRGSDAFVCLSEHEGFGVPLVEAMGFSLPILAHPAAAVAETMGDAGIKVPKQDRLQLLQSLDSILNDAKTRARLIDSGLKRYSDFSWEKLTKSFDAFFSTLPIFTN